MKYTDSTQIIRAMETKTEIIALLKELPLKVSQDLLYNFEKEGFFEAPASIKHHNNFTGGLALHCLNVFHNLRRLYKAMYGCVTSIVERRLILIAFCHDLCKLDDYVFDEEHNEWIYADNFLPGHAKRSLEKLEAWGIELEPEVRTSIQFHMGAFEKKEYTWDELSDANNTCPLSMLTHMADCLEAHNVRGNKMLNAKVGDKLVLKSYNSWCSRYVFRTYEVVKVTPKGQYRLDNGTLVKPNGSSSLGGKFELFTPEIQRQMDLEKIIDEARWALSKFNKIENRELRNLPTDILYLVAEVSSQFKPTKENGDELKQLLDEYNNKYKEEV